jgi:hypothetical protein
VGFAIFGAGMFVFTTMGMDFELPRFWTGLALMASGMALSAVPATTAITSSLPPEKQGVASAVNDVSRELGSAVGIALLGSALNTTYRSHLDPTLTKLSPDLAERFRGSVAFVKVDPQTIVDKFPQAKPILGMWDQLVAAGQSAFSDGMHVALTISGTVALAAAVFIAVVAPNRMPTHDLGE